ncbi:hypothetical protein V0288_04620 [Pannus brasiliensis CCIBt3594]|uniref:Uncharacterized protein n=1 Tax=Pannus brasiliensis CCIBt3594 TaxID=1427578 RepID=A0AAW9QF57_9CHRO
MDDDRFFEFCQLNGDLHAKRNVAGEIILIPPAEGETGKSNAVREIGSIDFWKGKFGAIERSIGEGIHEARYNPLYLTRSTRSEL